jgi:VWFA-related protein
MRHAPVFLAVVLASVSVAALPQTGTRTVYVTVAGGNQPPVPDLTAADLVVKEDGKPREIVEARRATAPMQVVLMLDDGGLGLGAIRQGAGQFVQDLQGLGEFAIIAMGAQNIPLVDFASDPRVLYAGLERMLARSTPAAHVLDGLLEVAQTLQRRGAERPVIVVVASEGGDFSNARPDVVLDAIQKSGAQVFYIGLGVPVTQGSRPSFASERPHDSTEDEASSRNAVLGAAPKNSGGRSEQALQTSGVVALMKQFAADLRGQYAVTYTTDATQAKLSVETKRKGVKVRAPARVGGK